MKSLSTILLSLVFFISCNKESLVDNQVAAHEIDWKSDLINSSENHLKGPIKVFPSPQALQIDGLEKDWKRAPKHKLRTAIDLGFELEGNNDLVSYFKMLWDEGNLYVFAKIIDQDINVASEQIFDKDGLEIYIDGNNSKTVGDPDSQIFPPAAYGDNTDFFRFIPGGTSALSAWNIINTSSFESVVLTTAQGYNVEVKIPFEAFPNFNAESGQRFGLEFQVNDNDDGKREHLYKWWSDSDFSYLDPSVFGTAVLF